MGVKRAKAAAAEPPTPLDARFVRTGARTFAGHVLDRANPGRVFAVELVVDGRPVAVAPADRYAPELAGCGDACHGFGFRLDDPPEPASRIEARLANLDRALGEPISGSDAPVAKPSALPEIHWLGGLRFAAWLPADAESGDIRLGLLVDGALVAEARPTGWGRSTEDAPGRIFDLHLPERFADGRLHRLALRDDDGERLPVAPVPFVADAAGFATLLTGPDRPRGELLDRLLPASFPMARYAEWRDRFGAPSPPPSGMTLAVVLAGPGNPEATLESLARQTHESWLAAVLPPGEGPADFDPADLRDFLAREGRDSAAFLFTLPGTRLASDALARLASAVDGDPQVALAYPDVAVEAADGALWPLCFPAFDYERLLEQGYCCHLFAMRRDALDRALARKAGSLYRLFNAVLDGHAPGEVEVAHLPGEAGVLPDFDRVAAAAALAKANRAHLGRGVRSDPGAGAILPVVHVRRPFRQLPVSIVVPCPFRGPGLAGTIERLRATAPEASVLVVAGADVKGEAEVASGDGVSLVRGAGPTARLVNLAVERCEGEFVCLIAPGLAPQEGWLEELCSRADSPGAGAVAPLLLRADAGIVEAGIVAGPDFALAPAHYDRTEGDPGYGDLLLAAHQQSVPGSGLILLRRADYLAAGGIDAVHFPEHFAVADLCLRLAASGRRNLVAPAARVIDRRPGRRHPLPSERRDARYDRELACLRARWGGLLAADPFYSPLLATSGAPFSALAWPPRPRHPRLPAVPPPEEIPPGF